MHSHSYLIRNISEVNYYSLFPLRGDISVLNINQSSEEAGITPPSSCSMDTYFEHSSNMLNMSCTSEGRSFIADSFH